MALRTPDMRRIPTRDLTRYIDTYIREQVARLHPREIKANKANYILHDDAIDSENWKYSLDTDGMNQISLYRAAFYKKPSGVFDSFEKREKYHYTGVKDYLPQNVLDFILSFKVEFANN
jgi:hypothetical protein